VLEQRVAILSEALGQHVELTAKRFDVLATNNGAYQDRSREDLTPHEDGNLQARIKLLDKQFRELAMVYSTIDTLQNLLELLTCAVERIDAEVIQLQERYIAGASIKQRVTRLAAGGRA